MKAKTLIIGLLAAAMPIWATAETELQFPVGTVQGFEELKPSDSLQLPVGPYVGSGIETTAAEGTVLRRVWKTPGAQNDTLSLIKPLRAQLEDAGFHILFECETRNCGGFDFRFEADVVEEPLMHVDLGDFRYLSASRIVDGEEEFIGLLVSRSPDRGFIQVTKVGAPQMITGEVVASTKEPEAEATEAAPKAEAKTLADKLGLNGAVVLEGLEFLKGSSKLSGSPAESLQDLAEYLRANKQQVVVLVGHTDASGSLEGNVKLSRKRAESVMQRLVDTYGVDPERLSAEGVGYLAPRSTNATEEGRELNRRVEVVLTTSK